MSLTRRQLDALRFIAGFQMRFGFGPSYSEIAAGLGLKSKSGAHRVVIGLEERGAVRVLPARSRSIEILKPIEVPRAPDGEPLYSVQIGEVAL